MTAFLLRSKNKQTGDFIGHIYQREMTNTWYRIEN